MSSAPSQVASVRKIRVKSAAALAARLVWGLVLPVACLLFALPQSARGQSTFTWSSGTLAGTTNWNTATNWNPSTNYPGGSVSTSDTASFVASGGSLNTSVTLSAPITIGQLAFSATNASGYSIGASAPADTLSLTSGTAYNALNNTGTNSISANIVLGTASAGYQFNQAGETANFGGGSLLLSGAISGGTSNSSVIFNGPGVIYYTGNNLCPDAFLLTAVNTFQGTVNLKGGATQINSNAALGNAANAVQFTGTSFLDFNYNPGTNYNSRMLTVGSSATTWGLGVQTGIMSINPADLVVNNPNASFLKFGNGTLQLSANNQFGSGSLYLQAGVLDLNGYNLSIASYPSGVGAGGTIFNAFTNPTATLTIGPTNNNNDNMPITGNINIIYNIGTGNLLQIKTGGTISALSNTVVSGTLMDGQPTATFLNGPVTLGIAGGTAAVNFESGSGAGVSNAITVAGGDSGLITVTAVATYTPAYSGPITLNGPLSVNGAGGTSKVTLSGNISGSGSLASLNLVQLSGNNFAYSGNVSLSAGTLQMGSSGALNAQNSVSLSSGAALDLNATAGTIGTATTGVFSPTIAGLNSASGYGSVQNSTTGSGTAFVGTLNIGGSGTYNYSGLITATTGSNMALAVNLAGRGTQILSGASTFAGGTTINGGVLQLNTSPATPNVLPGSGAVTLGGGVLSVQGNFSATAGTQNIGTLTLAPNTSSAILLGDLNSATGTSLAAGALTASSTANGATLYLNRANGGNLTLGTTPSAAFAPWAVVRDSTGTGFGAVTAAGQLVRDTNTLVLASTSNSSGTDFTTTPGDPGYSGGTLTLQSGTGVATDSLFINAAASAALDLGGQTLNFTSNALGMSGSGNYTISDGTLGASGALLTVNHVGSGALLINGPISGGSGGLTKAGSGLMVLGAAMNYSGTTTVSGGTLQLGSGGGLPGGNALATTGMGVLDVNGASAALGQVGNGGTITNSSGTAATLTIGHASAGAGNWTGNLNVVWNETTGTNTISGNWSNSGNITLNATGSGTLALSGLVNNAGSIYNVGSGTGAAIISGNLGGNLLTVTESSAKSILVLSGGANTAVFSGGLNVSLGTVQAGNANGLGAGTVTLGTGTSNGVLDLNGLTVNISSLASGSGTAAGDIIGNSSTSTNAVLNYTGANNSTFGGVIQNYLGGNSTKATAVTLNNPFAQLVLTNTNTYSGATTVSSGTLLTNNVQGFGGVTASGTAAITLSGGFLALRNDNNVTFSPTSGSAGYNVTVNGSPVINVASSSGTASGNTLKLGNLTIGSNGLTFTNGGSYSLSMGTVNATGSPTFTNLMSYGIASLAGITASSTQTDTFNGASLSAVTTVGVIGQSSSANILSLTMGGSGKLLLTGSNTYTGNTTLNAGTLTAGVAENANSSGPFGKQPASAAGTILFGGGTLQYSAANNADYSGRFSTAGVQPISIDTNGQSVTFASAIQGAGTSLNLNDSTGAGSLTLSNTSTYTGPTTVSTGQLIINSSGALGNTAVNLSGGTLTLQNAAAVSQNTLTVSGGNLVETAANALAGSAALTVSGGTTALSQSNSYSGATTVSSGLLNLSGSLTGATAVAVNGGTLFESGSGVISAATAFTLGGGYAALSGANTYAGPTTVNGGTLLLDFSQSGAAAANIINNASIGSALVLGGGTLSLTGNLSTANSQQFNGLGLNPGPASAIILNANGNPLLLSLGAVTRAAGGATVDFTLPGGTPSGNNGVTTAAAALGNVLVANGTAFATVGGSDWAALSNGNIVGLSTLSGSGYTTTTAAGTAASSYAAANIDVTNSPGTLSAAITPNTFRFNTGAAETVTLAGGANVIGAGGILVTANVGSNLSTITGGTLEGSTGGNELVVIQNNPGGGLMIASVVADNAAASALSKSGLGLLMLTGSNSYTGQTTINGGMLSIGSNAALGAPAAGAQLNINAGALQAASTFALSNSGSNPRAVVLGTLGGTIDVTPGNTLTISGNVSGSGGLTKTDGGGLALSGNNTLLGGVALTAGTLDVNSATALGSGPLAIAAGTSLDNSGSGAVVLSTNNPQAWNGGFTFNGSNSLNLGSGAVILGGSCLVTTNAATLTIGGNVGDGGHGYGLTKAGAGTLTLAGVDSFSGSVIVNAGALVLSGAVTAANGMTVNAGTLTLSGANIFAGGVRLNAGLLDINNGAALGVGSLTIGAGTTIDNNSGAVQTLANNNRLIFNGNFTYLGTNTLNLGMGNVTMSAPLTITTNALTLTVGGVISGSPHGLWDITKAGSGTLALNQPVTLAGNQTLTASNLVAGTLSLGGPISDTGSGYGLTMSSGSAALALAGLNTFRGGVTLTAGTLDINSTTALGSGTLTIGAGTTIDNNSAATQTLANNNPQVWNGNFTFLGSVHSLNLGTGSVTMTAPVTIAANALTLTVGGNIGDGGHGYGLTVASAGTLALTGSNSYSGGTTISGGNLVLDFSQTASPAANILSGSSALTFAGGSLGLTSSNGATVSQTINPLTVNPGAASIAITGGNSGSNTLLAIGAINRAVGGTVNFNQPTGNTTTSASNGYSTTGGNTSGSILGGWATVGGSDWAAVSSSGTIVGYSTLATYSSDTWSPGNNTTVTISSAPAAGSATNSLRFNTAAANTVTLSGTNVISSGGILVTSAVGNSLSTITGGTLAGASGMDLVVFQNSTGTLAIASTIADNTSATGLTKSGSGAVTLSGNNTYSGPTYINAGSLTLSGTNTTSGGTYLNNGTLNLTNAAALGSGTLTINGGALNTTSATTVTLSTNNPQVWNGSFSVPAPISTSLNLGSGPVTLNNNIQITAGSGFGSLSLVVGGVISGNYGLTIAGGGSSGTIYLTGNNSFGGGVTLGANGMLAIGNSNALGGGTLTINSGTILAANAPTVANPITLNGNLGFSNNGGLPGNGSGATFTGNVALTGSRALSPSILGWSFNGAISDGGSNYSLTYAGGGFANSLTLGGSNTFGGGLTITGGAGAATLNIGNLGSGPTNSAVGTGTLTINPGSGGVSINNTSGTAGTLATNNAEVWNGDFTFLGAKSLNMGNGAVSLGTAAVATRTVTVNANTLTIGGVISNGTNVATSTTALNKAGAGTLVLTASNAYTGLTTVSAGTLQLGDGAVNNGSVQGNIFNTAALVFANATAETYAGAIGGNGGLTVAGAATLTLTGSSNYSGTTSVSAGTLEFTTIANVNAGANTSLGNPATGNGTINLGSAGFATLRFIGDNANTNRVIDLQGAAAIDASGPSQSDVFQLAGSNSVTYSSGAGANLTLQGSSTVGGVIHTPMNLGSGSLTKAGSGTWELDTANTYSGGTYLNAGTLLLANPGSGSALGSGNLTINGGTLTTVAANVTISGSVASGTGPYTIAPGTGPAQFSDLLVGGLSTASNQTTLQFDLGSPVSNGTYSGDLITISNSSASSLSVAPNTAIALSPLPTSVGSQYRLLAYSNSSALAGDLSDFTLPAGPGVTYSLSATSDQGYLDLIVNAGTAFSGSATWVSSSGTTWNNNSNWQDGNGTHGVPGVAPRPTNSDTAAFSGSGSVTAITVDVPVSLAALAFSTSNYTLSGGSLALDSGSGTPTVTVSSGTQAVASSTVVTLASPAEMLIANGAELKIAANIGQSGGSQALLKYGPGELVLSGSNTYSGGTNVNAGTLVAASVGALPNGTSLTVASGGTLVLDSNAGAGPVAASAGDIIAVPEPGTFALFIVGLVIALGIWQRTASRWSGFPG